MDDYELEGLSEVEQSIQADIVQQSLDSNNLLPSPLTLALGHSSSTIVPVSCSEHEDAIESDQENLQLNIIHSRLPSLSSLSSNFNS